MTPGPQTPRSLPAPDNYDDLAGDFADEEVGIEDTPGYSEQHEELPKRAAFDPQLEELAKSSMVAVRRLHEFLNEQASSSADLRNMIASAEARLKMPEVPRMMVALVGATGAGEWCLLQDLRTALRETRQELLAQRNRRRAELGASGKLSRLSTSPDR